MTDEERNEILKMADEIADWNGDNTRGVEDACEMLYGLEPRLRKVAERREGEGATRRESEGEMADEKSEKGITTSVTFWDKSGQQILTIHSYEIDTDVLVDIFDTPAIRKAIEKATGHQIADTSEECDDEL